MQTKDDKVAEAAHQRRQKELKQQYNARIQTLVARINAAQERLEKTKVEQDAALQTRKDNWTKSLEALSIEQEKLSYAGFDIDVENYNENRLKVLTLNSEITQLDKKHKSLILKGPSAEQEILQISAQRKEKKRTTQATSRTNSCS